MRDVRRAVISSVAVLCLLPTASAGTGVAELTLDRGAVRALVASALPEPLPLALPGLGAVTLGLDGPTHVEFVEGAIEMRLGLEVPELGLRLAVAVRYLPEVVARSGVTRLVPTEVRTEPALPFEVDLARWMGSVDLPRRVAWDLVVAEGRSVEIVCFVQAVEVDEERLRLELGLVARPPRGG